MPAARSTLPALAVLVLVPPALLALAAPAFAQRPARMPDGMSEAQWLATARSLGSRPPMPWFALRDVTDEDLRAIYQYVRSLGPAGTPAPPYVQFPEPLAPEPAAKAK